MRFGCCLNMIASKPDGTGMEYLEELAAAGFHYAELPLAELMELTDQEFQALVCRLTKLTIHCETCNNFFPKTCRLTGEDVDRKGILSYVEKALDRAQELGVTHVVFGSGGAKNVPKGFSMEQGYQQVVALLKEIAPLAASRQIVVCIEPLRKEECNLINTFQEGCDLARAVNHEQVRVLVDFYHMSVEQEPVEHIRTFGKEFLRHVHYAKPDGRRYPGLPADEKELEFFQVLREIGYDGSISCEAYTDDFPSESRRALAFFKENTEIIS